MNFYSGQVTLELSDLVQVSTVSHKGTLGLFPIGKKGTQRFVIGDDSSTVHCFEMKRGEAKSSFSSRLADSNGNGGSGGSGSMVTAVAMGGTLCGLRGGDRVFATQGSSIVGLSKKGKEFFRMASPLSETIHHMAVEGERIWTGCDYICSAYDNGQDAAFYMCQDKIASLVGGRLPGGKTMDAIVGCQDSCIRIIRAEGSHVTFQAFADGPVSALCSSNAIVEGTDRGTGEIFCGTDHGTIGLFGPAPDGANHLRKLWQLPGGGNQLGGHTVARGVTALKLFDLTSDGVAELIAGREDGTVRVYRFPSVKATGTSAGVSGTHTSSPKEVFCASLGQSVRSLEAGRVSSSEEHPEVVACTFRGRVCSLKTQALGQVEEGDAFGRSVDAINNENHAKQIKREVMDLEKHVAMERKRLEEAARKDSRQATSAAYTPATQHFQAITSCYLDPEQGAYLISVETPVPLDLILIHSQVHMDIIESNDPGEVGQAIGSMKSLSPEDGGGECATYHFEGEATRFKVRARTTEGDYGDVRLTVVANIPPKKSAQVIHFCIKPLSLHHRIHETAPDWLSKRPLSSLVLQGNFTMQVAHDWLAMCLPEVPSRLSEEVEDFTLDYRNVFTGGILRASYRRGIVTLRSDSASTLAIVKELVSKEATARRVHITDAFQGEPDSIPSFLKLLDPKLTAQFALTRQVKLMDALKEISMQESDTSWMFDEYRYILDNSEQIKQEFQRRPKALEYISGIITDLYVDWHKFRGYDARHHIPKLEDLLTHRYDYSTIVAFFLKRP